MKKMIAMDVGGTKTDAVLFDETGKVLKHSITPGANPLDVGTQEAIRRYQQAYDTLLDGFDLIPDGLYAGVAAINYVETDIPALLKDKMKSGTMRIEGDGSCLISTMLGHNDGAALICGTGSSLCIRRGEISSYIGGWGYQVDGCASGYVLGKRGLNAIAKSLDGRKPATLIHDFVTQKCGKPVPACLEWIYAGGRARIASLASCVFDARRAGDYAAELIIDDCIAELSELVWTARRVIGHPFTLVLNGGIFRHYPEYSALLKAHAPMDVTMLDSDAPPLYGCAVEAMYDQGLACDENFRKKFLDTYQETI